jgi:hypothetical protein
LAPQLSAAGDDYSAKMLMTGNRGSSRVYDKNPG